MNKADKITKTYNEIRDLFIKFSDEMKESLPDVSLTPLQLFFSFETKHRNEIYDKYGKDGYGVLEHMRKQLTINNE